MEKRLIWATVLLLASRCHHDHAQDRFVRFYADVVTAQRSAMDSSAAAESAFAVARRHHMTSEELARFADAMRENPERWVRVWEAVMERVGEPARRRGPPG